MIVGAAIDETPTLQARQKTRRSNVMSHVRLLSSTQLALYTPLQIAIMGGGEHIPMNDKKVSPDPGQNVYLHAVVDLGR